MKDGFSLQHAAQSSHRGRRLAESSRFSMPCASIAVLLERDKGLQTGHAEFRRKRGARRHGALT